MTTEYRVEPDRESLREAIRFFEFIGGNSQRAIQVAINKAGPKIRTKASKEIRSQIRLKASYVNSRLKFDRASAYRLEGRIKTPARGLLLSRFSTDPRIAGDNVSWIRPPATPPRGIRVKVKPGAGTKVVNGDNETEGKPFYMILADSGRVGIAARRKTPGPRGGKIKVFHGPSLSQVFTDVKDEVDADGEYTAQLADAMRYLIAQRRPQ